MLRRTIVAIVALSLLIAVPMHAAVAAETDGPGKLCAAVGDESGKVALSTQAEKKSGVSKKNQAAAIKTVKTFLKAAKTYNTKKMSRCFTNPKEARGFFFNSSKSYKFMVKYGKKYNKHIQYKDFKVKKVKGGLKVTCKVKVPYCSNVNFSIQNDYEYWLFDYQRKYGEAPSSKKAVKAWRNIMRQNWRYSQYYSDATQSQMDADAEARYLKENPDDPDLEYYDEDFYGDSTTLFDDPSAVLEWDWENKSFTLKKVKGKWRMVNRVHKYSKVKGATWHDVDIANLGFEKANAVWQDSMSRKNYVKDRYEEYLELLHDLGLKYYML